MAKINSFAQVTNPKNDGNAPLICSTHTTNEILDLEQLSAFERVKSDDGGNIVIELIDLYLQATPQRILTIRKAAVEKQWILLQRTTHTVKGSSSTLGLRQLTKACEMLEDASSSAFSNIVEDLVEMVESEFAHAQQALFAERNRRLPTEISFGQCRQNQ